LKTNENEYRLNTPLRTDNELNYVGNLTEALKNSSFTETERAIHFSLYASRQRIAEFLCRYEMFKRIVNVHGSIIECGVSFGSGIMSFAHFSSILEPVNFTRKVIGFDTFEGFPTIADEDKEGSEFDFEKIKRKGGHCVNSYDELKQCRDLFDQNRSTGHINKIELVKGDAIKTIPKYIDDNAHLVVALLYLDFDLYEPTRVAMKYFIPRMPKGSIIAFDELNHPDWPGETLAVFEEIGISNLRIERYEFDSIRSFAVME